MASSEKLPGFNVPLDYRPEDDSALFPNALDYSTHGDTTICRLNTFREILIMRVINGITDKPEWQRKVFDQDIMAKWKDEIYAGGGVTPKMMDWIVDEAQWKAKVSEVKDFVRIYDAGVVKSDTAVTRAEQEALKAAMAPLEQVPEDQKDYHPGSNSQVVDLVHPSLYPLIYGRTRILPDMLIGHSVCTSYIGQGEVLKVPADEEAGSKDPPRDFTYANTRQHRPYSQTFQWLPCEVQFTDEGNGCHIVSHINNLHPGEHQPLYTAIESILGRAIDLWDETLALARQPCPRRITYNCVDYLPHSEPEPEPRSDQDSDSESFCDLEFEWSRSRPIKLPEPGVFDKKKVEIKPRHFVNLRKEFHNQLLQVIVKLATIELTPEKPKYKGGSWHIEGQLNERICATAIYYYDNENITDSTLAFRQNADRHTISRISYEQGHFEFLQAVFGFGPEVNGGDRDTNVTQHLGSVLCKEGRLVTFPNILQHRVSPFKLKDPSKPGHRKILAFFLIDPNQRIISTMHVPPQQEAWEKEKEKLVDNLLRDRLPPELQHMVKKDLATPSISWDEAKEYRLKLMSERSARAEENDEFFETGAFDLCEH